MVFNMDGEDEHGVMSGGGVDLSHLEEPYGRTQDLVDAYKRARAYQYLLEGRIDNERFLAISGSPLPDHEQAFPMVTGERMAGNGEVPVVFPMTTGHPGAPEMAEPPFPMTTGQPGPATEEDVKPRAPHAAIERAKIRAEAARHAVREQMDKDLGSSMTKDQLNQIDSELNRELGLPYRVYSK